MKSAQCLLSVKVQVNHLRLLENLSIRSIFSLGTPVFKINFSAFKKWVRQSNCEYNNGYNVGSVFTCSIFLCFVRFLGITNYCLKITPFNKCCKAFWESESQLKVASKHIYWCSYDCLSSFSKVYGHLPPFPSIK